MPLAAEDSSRRLTRDDLASLPQAPPDAVLAYGPETEQFGHLYLPESAGPHPIVALLHGGCWRAPVTLRYLSGAARRLSHDGLAVWNLEYRRLGNGGGWPTTFQDVAKGADFLRTLAPAYSLDLSRALAVGHSAGAHLALWLAARARLPATSALYQPEPLPLTGVVAIAGIPDLAEAARRGVCQEAPEALMGGPAEDLPERYREGSPSSLLPLGVRQVFIQGEEDAIVSAEYVKLYQTEALEHGDDVRLELLPDTGHFEPIAVHTPQWRRVRRAVQGLLGKDG